MYQYLTVTYYYLVNAYIVKAIFNWSWPIFEREVQACISKTGLASIGNRIEIQNPLNSAEILSPNKKAAR